MIHPCSEEIDRIIVDLKSPALSVDKTQTTSAKQFYASVLPELREDCSYCVSHQTVDGIWRDEPAKSVEDVFELIKKYKQHNVYVALASFTVLDGKFSRKAKFANQVQSLWIDIDCNHDGESHQYGTKQDALDALKATAVLPKPTYVVDSGNGIHAYWVLDRPMDASEAKVLADQVRDVLLGAGLKFDSSLTGNMACVLRALNSCNLKGGVSKPLAVKVIRTGDVLPVEVAKQVRVGDSSVVDVGINDDLSMPVEEINLSELLSALEHISPELYPTWRETLCGLKSVDKEGIENIARQWSYGSQKHTDDRFDKEWVGITADGGRTVQSVFFDARANGWDGKVSITAAAKMPDLAPAMFEKVVSNAPVGGMAGLINKFTMSAAAIAKLESPTWLIPNLIIKGHMSVFPAAPNAGKTTIFVHVAGELAAAGQQVLYVNADISASDVKRDMGLAMKHGFKLLLPDLVGKGLSMSDVVNALDKMVVKGDDLSNTVFIFDTLKKMTDVINKSQAKKLFKLFRAMTGSGATIICLAHTNKYNGDDGKPVFEGTGDLRADFDELIYLIPIKNPDGSMEVSTSPDKVRGDFKPVTYKISADRKVTLAASYVNTAQRNKDAKQRMNDDEAITAITHCISQGVNTVEKIISKCVSDYDITRRIARNVLKRYKFPGKNQLWVARPQAKNNKIIYTLIQRGNP